eukprot:COSAG02_NODE_3628_length_6450_cov_12.534876_1_plen_50_part_00
MTVTKKRARDNDGLVSVQLGSKEQPERQLQWQRGHLFFNVIKDSMIADI